MIFLKRLKRLFCIHDFVTIEEEGLEKTDKCTKCGKMVLFTLADFY